MLKDLVYRFMRFLPIKNNRVLFIGYYGAQYGCNPKYISEYLTSHHRSDVEVVWAFTEPSKHLIRGIRKVRFGSLGYLKMLATSRFIITNYRMTQDFRKRSEQIYIQTWHSSLRLKKIEADTEDSLPKQYVEMAKRDSAQTDYVIAGCRMSHDTFANSFWYSGVILDIGTPRNDFLLNPDSKITKRIKEQLHIDKDHRIVVYAPTFRKNKTTDCYNIDFGGLKEALHEKFGGEWIVLLRLHPHLINCKLYKNEDDVIDVTRYDDIQELLMISDVLISDYSSLMFDFAISGRPVFLFATDIDDYCKNDRAFYFDIDELPFPLAVSNRQLMSNIIRFDAAAYRNKVNEFNNKVGTYEEGTASQSVSRIIIDKIKS